MSTVGELILSNLPRKYTIRPLFCYWEVIFAISGRFDFLGSSHQIWHGLVMLAFFWWHQAGRDILEYRTNNPCGDGAI